MYAAQQSRALLSTLDFIVIKFLQIFVKTFFIIKKNYDCRPTSSAVTIVFYFARLLTSNLSLPGFSASFRYLTMYRTIIKYTFEDSPLTLSHHISLPRK